MKAGTKEFKKQFNKELGKKKGDEANWDKLVECIDVDKDKKISFDEFVTAATNRRRLLTGKGHLQYVFDLLKNKEDDMLTLEGIKQKFLSGSRGSSQISPIDTSEWDTILEGIDIDGNGKISFKQFEHHML